MEQGEVWGDLSSSGAHRRVRGGRGAASWVAGAAVLAAVLTGCSEPEPEPTPPPATATPTPTPTPSETVEEVAAPERPAEMDRTDEVGAMAAAEYFLALHAYVLSSRELAEWAEISAPGCGFCGAVTDEVEALVEAGEEYRDGEVTFSEPEVVGFDEEIQIFAVQVPFVAEDATVVDSAGGVSRSVAGGPGYLVLDVGYAPDGWELLSAGARDDPVQS